MLLALLLTGMFSPCVAHANNLPVPTQTGWVAAKHHVKLPNGIDMAYIEMGNPAAKPLVMIHGVTDSSRTWSLLAPYIKNRRMIAIDLRAHGNTTGNDCCYTLPEFAHDVSLFITEMKLGKVDVIGHSLGSMTAQVLAATHPEQIDSVILVSSTSAPDIKPGTILYDSIMTLQVPADANNGMLKGAYQNPFDPAFETLATAESLHVPLYVWKDVIRGLMMVDLANIQLFIKAKMLIVSGDLDPYFPPSQQARLHSFHPDAKAVVFRDQGHNMFWEDPRRTANCVNDFLRGAPLPPAACPPPATGQ